MKAKDMRNLSDDEIAATLEDSRKQLYRLVNKAKREKKLEQPHKIRQTRRQIARLLTVSREKEIEKVG